MTFCLLVNKKKFVDQVEKMIKWKKEKEKKNPSVFSIFCCVKKKKKEHREQFMANYETMADAASDCASGARKEREVANRQISASYVARHAGI